MRRHIERDKGPLPQEWFVVYSGLIYRAMDHLDRLGVHWNNEIAVCEKHQPKC